MAHISTHAPTEHRFLNAVSNVLSAIGHALTAIPEANSKMRQIEALMALSDEELTQRGLRREDIARYVLGGSYL